MHANLFVIAMTTMAAHHVEIKTCIQILSEFIAAPRRLRLENIVRSRSNIASVLLENVIDTGNENAVTRTMEGVGFHHLYRLRSDSKLTTNNRLNKLQRTDSGARKWLVTHTYNNMKECVEAVRRDGYQLACAVPRAPCSIFDLGMGKKTAFVFGNESGGVSRLLQEESDVKFSLPMCGFVDSYNVSVAAAITLFQAYSQHKHTKDLERDDHMIDDKLLLRYYAVQLGQEKAEGILKMKLMKSLTELGITLSD